MAPPEYGACIMASVRMTDVAVKTMLVHIAVGLVSAAHPNAKTATVAQRLYRPKREQRIGNTRSRILSSDCKVCSLDHAFHFPPSSRARLSGPIMDHRFHLFGAGPSRC